MSVPASTLQCCGEDLLATPSFIIQAPTPAALFGGSLLGNIGEEQLRSTANFTLSITLSGDEWSAAMDTDDALRAELLNSLVATASSEYGWNTVVRGHLGLETLVLDRASHSVTITLPAFPLYDTNAPETITCTVPASTVTSGNRVFASPSFRIRTVSGGATLTGRLLQRTTEQDIRGAVTGSLTFELTIFDDFFTAMVGHRHIDPAATVTLLEGVRSAQSEPAGWNAVVLPALTKVNVERRTPTQLTVTLPRVPTYDISVPETVTVFLPPAAVSSGQRIVASPFFVIEADVGRAALRVLPDPRTAAVLPTTSATAATSTALSEASMRDLYPPSIGLVLSVDSWLQTLGMPTGAAATEALLAGIVSAQHEPYGWNAVVRPALLYTDVYRHNASTVTLTLPQLAAYEVRVRVTIPTYP